MSITAEKLLRPYQLDVLETLDVMVAKEIKSALIVLATGLGKTVVSARFSRTHLKDNEQLLFLAHTTDILRQARKEFDEAFDGSRRTGIITSAETENTDAQILFVTFQTMLNMLDEFLPDAFTYIIVDEAHHGQAVQYKKVIEHFTPKFLLGMTATPDRMDGQDIRDIFGEEVYSYPLARGIADGWLAQVDYKVMTDNISIKKLRELIRKITGGDRTVSRRQIDDTIFLEERLEEIARIARTEGEGVKKTIIFCNSLTHLDMVLAQFPNAKPYHSKLPIKVMAQTLQDFRDGVLKTIFVVDKLNEGVDIPDAELILFLRSTDSMTVWLQQLGRGTRKTPLKHRITVLDFVANCDRIIAVNELKLEITKHIGEAEKPEGIVVSDTGWMIEFSEDVRDLIEVLERLSVPFYSYHEAKVAVQLLNSVPKSGPEYSDVYMNDPRLPSGPQKIYAECGWIDWYDFLGQTRPQEKYETIEEAKAAVQLLNQVPKSEPEYSDVYMNDPRLPSNPRQTFAGKGWINWYDFLGQTRPQEKYRTIEEAKAAVQLLNPVPKVGRDYDKVYKQDPRLPVTPNEHYADTGWINWYDFLGQTRPQEKYRTIEEAKAAVQLLNPVPKVGRDYDKVYKQDPRLHSNPNTTYAGKGWVDWCDFLGQTKPPQDKYDRYETIEEAKAAIQLCLPAPRTRHEYRSSCDEDTRLPREPQRAYTGIGWIDWFDFLGKPRRGPGS